MRRLLLLAAALLLQWSAKAQNWDEITSSGKYYYGVGMSASEEEADQAALSELTNMISVNINSEFEMLTDQTTKNNETELTSRVRMCMQTYSQATLTNTEKWVLGKAPKITVRRYIKRTEIERIFEGRKNKARDMMLLADNCMEPLKLDMALQYYYWAYSLIRSVQYPNEVKDDMGHTLVDVLKKKIEDILNNITVATVHRDGETVDLSFTYQGQPISNLEFTYNDGRVDDCQGTVKDGRGVIELIPGYEKPVFHIKIEYQFIEQARGDAEVSGVLALLDSQYFRQASIDVDSEAPLAVTSSVQEATTAGVCVAEVEADTEAMAEATDPTQAMMLADVDSEYKDIMAELIEGIKNNNSMRAARHFTPEAKSFYDRLIVQTKGRIVGEPALRFFRGLKNNVVVRGLRMSFVVGKTKKKTFVEDLVFVFDEDKKIVNVAYGLGKVAEDDIVFRDAPNWRSDVRELILEFMENYRTAYSLKRDDYINSIFADDAVIIVGNVLKPATQRSDIGMPISVEGQDIIHYNKYTKSEYMANLRRCFRNNEFVNIRFGNNEVQWLEKYTDKELYGIQISQEYNSSSYADKGCLFLLIDMTDHDAPLIKVRTWQPNEVSMDNLYHAGYFFSE